MAGDNMELTIMTRYVVTTGAGSPHQLEGIMLLWKLIQIPSLQGETIRAFCGKPIAIAYINKFGGSKPQNLMDLSQKIGMLNSRRKRTDLEVYFNTFQSRGRTVTPTHSSTGMKNSSTILSPSQQQVEPTPSGPIGLARQE
jgi:hypothetical protein